VIINYKYADFVKFNNNIQMIKYVENLNNGYFKIIFKDMTNGYLREEILDDRLLNDLKITNCEINFVKKDDYYYYFIDKEKNEELKWTIPFIGSDFDYVIGIKEKEFERRVKPVKCNYNPNNIEKNSLVVFECETKDAIIYYSIDGTEPNEHSLRYEKPIEITDNVLIRTVAYKNGYIHSVISDFDFHLKSRQIKIFLSPSRQKYNVGIEGSGFTTEYTEMNLICNEIESILKNYDCILYRNNYETFIEDWSIINRNENIDCHLAIHSNATTGHWKKGIENWIHDEYSETYSLASLIYNNLYSIYYDNANPLTNRGVKYAKGKIAEASPAYFKFGMNLEIAYHDNLDDAKWIINNRERIAKVIANSLIDYYQLKEK